MTNQKEILNNLSKIKLLPVKYQPIMNYNFICEVEHVESYYVNKIVSMPKIYKSIFDTKDTFSCKGNLIIEYVADNIGLTHHQLFTSLHDKSKKIIVKFLDPAGDVSFTQTFSKCKLVEIQSCGLDYSNKSDTHKITAIFKCKKTKLS